MIGGLGAPHPAVSAAFRLLGDRVDGALFSQTQAAIPAFRRIEKSLMPKIHLVLGGWRPTIISNYEVAHS